MMPATEAAGITADIHNYPSVQPIIQISGVKMERRRLRMFWFQIDRERLGLVSRKLHDLKRSGTGRFDSATASGSGFLRPSAPAAHCETTRTPLGFGPARGICYYLVMIMCSSAGG